MFELASVLVALGLCCALMRVAPPDLPRAATSIKCASSGSAMKPAPTAHNPAPKNESDDLHGVITKSEIGDLQRLLRGFRIKQIRLPGGSSTAVVSSLQKGSPLERAAFEPGDVILKAEVVSEVTRTPGEGCIVCTILRGGRKKTLVIHIES